MGIRSVVIRKSFPVWRGVLLLFFVMKTLSLLGGNTPVTRMEPPFWWSGMTNDTLQLMLHGKDFDRFDVSVTSNTVRIISVVRPPNTHYLFLYLDLKDSQPGTFYIDFKSKKSTISYRIPYQLRSRNADSRERKGFSNEDVIYLIMPDRFANGDPSNDRIPGMLEGIDRNLPGGRHGGDIQGIMEHLDYLEDLGVTTLWSTPLLEDNLPAYSYHGYAISDYYRIDPRYGRLEDYQALAQALHHRGMRLIMDYVTNHCSSAHWWMRDLPYEDWVHQFPEFRRSNYRMSTQYDPYRAKTDYEGCEKGWFDTTMPDLNQSNPHLIRYLAQNAIWWMELAALDGLRVDTYSYNDKKGIAYWTKRIMDEYPHTNIVGEVWMHTQAEIAYWQSGNALSGNYDTHLPSVMDFPLHDVLAKAIREDSASWFDGIIKVYNNFVLDFVYPDPSNIVIFGENHDTDRLLYTLGEDIKRYKLALTLLLTTRGIPLLYYGTEVGLTGQKSKGDGDLRRDFPGGWKGDTLHLFDPLQRKGRAKELHDFTKKLLHLRKEHRVLQSGKLLHFIPENNVYVYFRYDDNALVMIVLNNGLKPVSLDYNRFSEIVSPDMKWYNAFSGKQIDKRHCIAPAKSPLILIKEENKTSR